MKFGTSHYVLLFQLNSQWLLPYAECFHSPHEVLVCVKDSGIGVAANEIPSIFKRFYRANNLDQSLSGLGIGLYLVREVVTHH